jgi:hypothetical protein
MSYPIIPFSIPFSRPYPYGGTQLRAATYEPGYVGETASYSTGTSIILSIPWFMEHEPGPYHVAWSLTLLPV